MTLSVRYLRRHCLSSATRQNVDDDNDDLKWYKYVFGCVFVAATNSQVHVMHYSFLIDKNLTYYV
jgi:hypothetical protein